MYVGDLTSAFSQEIVTSRNAGNMFILFTITELMLTIRLETQAFVGRINR